VKQVSQGAQSVLLEPLNELLNQKHGRDSADATRIYRYLVTLLLPGGAKVDRAVRRELLEGVKVLLPRVDEAVRAELVSDVLAMDQVGADLVLVLAQDKVSICEPLLRGADLSEDDVLELVKLTTRAHHQILADRKDLTANVWLALARAAPAMAGMRAGPRAVAADSAVQAAPAMGPARAVPVPADTPSDSAGATIRRLKPVDDLGPNILEDDSDIDRWSFRSDRDGFVTSVSNRKAPWFLSGSDPLGQTILDLLGLNDKLGHPVARAVQRRTAIHDVPMFIGAFPRGYRYWSLAATPRFRSFGGTFDGYDAILTAVDLEEAEDDVFTRSGDASTDQSVHDVHRTPDAQTFAGEAATVPDDIGSSLESSLARLDTVIARAEAQAAKTEAIQRDTDAMSTNTAAGQASGQASGQAHDHGAANTGSGTVPGTGSGTVPDTGWSQASVTGDHTAHRPKAPNYTEEDPHQVTSLDEALAAIAQSMARVDEELEARASAASEMADSLHDAHDVLHPAPEIQREIQRDSIHHPERASTVGRADVAGSPSAGSHNSVLPGSAEDGASAPKAGGPGADTASPRATIDRFNPADFDPLPSLLSDDVRVAFDHLGENLDKMQDALVRGDSIGVRLYADVAMAYYKAVRDQSNWD